MFSQLKKEAPTLRTKVGWIVGGVLAAALIGALWWMNAHSADIAKWLNPDNSAGPVKPAAGIAAK